ncbi:hypothetical protein SLA2020_046340 [Shorea laevis]
MVRAPFYDKNGVKKGAWSQEEDEKLRSYIQQYGYWNWRELPKFAGLSRIWKQMVLDCIKMTGIIESEAETESTVLAELIPSHLILEGSPLSPDTSCSAKVPASLNSNHGSMMEISNSAEIYEDFWTEPFAADNMYNNGYTSSSYMARTVFEVPYYDELFYDDGVDLLY